MGANGSFASGRTSTEEGCRWRTVMTLPNGVIKDRKANHKAPEESHSPNSVYVMFNKNGDGIKSISKYGADGKKEYEIHTVDHKGLGIHYHKWGNGKPLPPQPLTDAMKHLLNIIKSYI